MSTFDDDLLFYSEEISDEIAFYLIPFFYRLAYSFEKKHLTKARQHERKNLQVFHSHKPWEEE